MREYQACAVVHGLGYSKFSQQIEDIASELTLFVAAADPVEVFQLKLTNHSSDQRELDVTSYAEWLRWALRRMNIGKSTSYSSQPRRMWRPAPSTPQMFVGVRG